MESRQFRELDRIDGEPMEFDWNLVPGFTTSGILAEINKMMTEINLSTSKEGSSSCQCITTLNGEKKGNREKLYCEFLYCCRSCSKTRARTFVVPWPGSEKKCHGTHVYKPNGEWDEVAEIVMKNFSESGHPDFRGSSAFDRGDLKSKGKGRSTVHSNSSDGTIEVILRTTISVNQLSIYGAIADVCGELAWEVFRNSEGHGETRSA